MLYQLSYALDPTFKVAYCVRAGSGGQHAAVLIDGTRWLLSRRSSGGVTWPKVTQVVPLKSQPVRLTSILGKTTLVSTVCGLLQQPYSQQPRTPLPFRFPRWSGRVKMG